MVEISGGLQKAVQKLAEQAAESAKTETAQPQQADIQKFQEGMQQSGGQDQLALGDPLANSQVASVAPAGTAAPVEAAGSPGETVLKGLDKLRNEYQTDIQQVEKMTDGGQVKSFDAQEMLRVQVEIQRVSLEVDLMGKVASKGTQDVNQLLKNQ